MAITALKLPPAAASPTWSGVVRFTLDHFLLLPIGGLIAIIWANSRPESYFATARDLAFVVNEIGMALFFALMAQEIVEAVMPGGALHTWRRWTLPLLAAAGAVSGSAAIYLLYVTTQYQYLLVSGWPAAGAIDIAFAYMIVRSIFRRHPAVPFVLLVAIAADAFGAAIIASRAAFVDVRPGGTALLIAALGSAFALRRWRVRSVWPYLLLCGPLAWWAAYFDGIHPALALVPIVPFMSHTPRRAEFFEEAPHSPHDAPTHLEHLLKYPVHVVLFFFGLVNAGVVLNGYEAGTWALLWGAMVGKPIGLLAGVGVALLFGLHMPHGLRWRDLIVVALATCGGFAFALFFATAVFPPGPTLTELKIGAIASGIGVPMAYGVAWLTRAGRFGVGRRGAHLRHAPAV